MRAVSKDPPPQNRVADLKFDLPHESSEDKAAKRRQATMTYVAQKNMGSGIRFVGLAFFGPKKRCNPGVGLENWGFSFTFPGDSFRCFFFSLSFREVLGLSGCFFDFISGVVMRF